MRNKMIAIALAAAAAVLAVTTLLYLSQRRVSDVLIVSFNDRTTKARAHSILELNNFDTAYLDRLPLEDWVTGGVIKITDSINTAKQAAELIRYHRDVLGAKATAAQFRGEGFAVLVDFADGVGEDTAREIIASFTQENFPPFVRAAVRETIISEPRKEIIVPVKYLTKMKVRAICRQLTRHPEVTFCELAPLE